MAHILLQSRQCHLGIASSFLCQIRVPFHHLTKHPCFLQLACIDVKKKTDLILLSNMKKVDLIKKYEFDMGFDQASSKVE